MTGTTGDAFRVPDARRAGVPRRRIDGDEFDRPFRGLRARHEDESEGDRYAQARARILKAVDHWALHMHDGEYFSHVTAAIIWELPLPASVLLSAELHVSGPRRATRMHGATGHQIKEELVTTVIHPTLNVRVSDPATTWAMLGATLWHLYDLVAVGDAIVRTPRVPGPAGRIKRPALASIEELGAAARAGRRRRADDLREALLLIRTGSASRLETWTRLTLVGGGLPEPELDFDVYDGRGRFVGCVDMVYREQRIAIEYEGDQHRTDAAQWERDIEKHERLTDIGWRVVRVSREQIFTSPGQFAQRVRTLLRSRSRS